MLRPANREGGWFCAWIRSRLVPNAPKFASRIEYDFEFDAEGKYVRNATSPIPGAILNMVGPSVFHDIVGVNLDGAHVAVADLKTLRSLPNLRRLDVEYNSVSPEFLQTIGSLSKLESLDLQETGISDDDLASIASLANLRNLRLSDHRITDAGLVHLAAMQKLRILAIRFCSVNGPGLAHLPQSLHSLELRWSPVSDASRDAICGLKNLRQLDLSGTKVSEQTVDFLRKALPECTVVHE